MNMGDIMGKSCLITRFTVQGIIWDINMVMSWDMFIPTELSLLDVPGIWQIKHPHVSYI